MMRKLATSAVSITAAAAMFAVAIPGTASAAPTPDELVNKLTPDSATQLSSEDLVSSSEPKARTRTEAVEQDLTLELSDSEGEHSVQVSLKDSMVKPAKGDAANTPVAEDASGSAVYAQEINNHQSRIITSIDDENDAASFEYSFELDENQHLATTEDGIPFVYDKTGDTYSIVTIMAEPWAKDANGASLSTTYEVIAANVTQHVDTTGAAYPVVADPTWTVGGAKAVVPSIRGGAADVYLNKTASHDFNGANNWVCGSVAAVTGLALPALGVGLGVACGAQALMYSVSLRHNMCIVLTAKAYPPFFQPSVYYKTSSYGSWCR